jgi:hypothetical protein
MEKPPQRKTAIKLSALSFLVILENTFKLSTPKGNLSGNHENPNRQTNT